MKKNILFEKIQKCQKLKINQICQIQIVDNFPLISMVTSDFDLKPYFHFKNTKYFFDFLYFSFFGSLLTFTVLLFYCIIV